MMNILDSIRRFLSARARPERQPEPESFRPVKPPAPPGKRCPHCGGTGMAGQDTPGAWTYTP